jgi:hypothetical protein
MKKVNTAFEDSFGNAIEDTLKYCNVAAAAIGGSVVTGILGSQAAGDAASTQANAATQASNNTLQAQREANQLQWQMYQQQLANQSPYMQGGQMGYQALLSAMGLGGLNAGQSTAGSTSGGTQTGNYTNAAGQTVDAKGNAVTGLTNGATQNYGASQAQLNQAADQYAGALTGTFKPSDLTTDPSYQWRLNQGLQALKASGAATGMLQTGQGLKDINDYAQGAASQEYQNAFNRYQTNQNNIYNRLQGIIAPGSAAATAAGTAAQSTGSNIANTTMSGTAASNNYLTSGAAAQAAGSVGSTNALTGAFNSGLNNWMGLQALNKYGGSGTGGGYYAAGEGLANWMGLQ